MNLDAQHIIRQMKDVLEKSFASNTQFDSYTDKHPDARQDFADVPTADDDDEYKTNVDFPMEQVKEAEEEEAPPEEEMPAEEAPEEGGEMPPDAEMGGMEGMPGEEGMGDMGGMGEEDEGPQDLTEVGRRFELKKIYTRLVAIQAHLNTATDEELIDIRNFVSQALNLFKVLINNIDLYKEKIDEVLIVFYKFVVHVYDMLSKYYKTKANKEK